MSAERERLIEIAARALKEADPTAATVPVYYDRLAAAVIDALGIEQRGYEMDGRLLQNPRDGWVPVFRVRGLELASPVEEAGGR